MGYRTWFIKNVLIKFRVGGAAGTFSQWAGARGRVRERVNEVGLEAGGGGGQALGADTHWNSIPMMCCYTTSNHTEIRHSILTYYFPRVCLNSQCLGSGLCGVVTSLHGRVAICC